MALYYSFLFIIAIVCTWSIFNKVLKIAIMKNIVDNPSARKLQKVPVPVLGGVAVFFGIVSSLIVAGLFYETSSLYAILGLLVVMVYIGLMDDILSLSPFMRFVIEIVLMLLLIFCNHYSLNDFHGLWGIDKIPEYISIPLTVFVCVGIINSINLIDGVNGLCSGFCIMTCGIFAAAFIIGDDKEAASLAVMSVGALVPFFFHNVFGLKSKMFLGDSGSLLMGTIISSFVIGALNTNSPLAEKVDVNFGLIPFVMAVLAIPIFDTLRVMACRIAQGKSPFMPDTNHLHHLLLEVGFSHIGTMSFIIFSNFLIIVSWYVSYKLGLSIDMQLYVVLLLSFLMTFGFYKTVTIIRRKNNNMYKMLQKFGQWTHFGHTNGYKWLRVLMDKDCDNLKSEIN